MTAVRDLMPLLAWKSAAACAGVDPELFFPAPGESAAAAKAGCASCVAREACLEYALVVNERHGIWGGKSEHERRAMRGQFMRARRMVEMGSAG